MKAILVLVVVFAFPPSTFATVYSPPPPPNETAEAVTISVSAMVAVTNIALMASKTPSYWIGGAGIVAGMTAFGFAFSSEPAYELGLWIAGTAAISTGLFALRYRYVLNQKAGHARLEPAWTNGSPGLALVVDF